MHLRNGKKWCWWLSRKAAASRFGFGCLCVKPQIISCPRDPEQDCTSEENEKSKLLQTCSFGSSLLLNHQINLLAMKVLLDGHQGDLFRQQLFWKHNSRRVRYYSCLPPGLTFFNSSWSHPKHIIIVQQQRPRLNTTNISNDIPMGHHFTSWSKQTISNAVVNNPP